MKKERKETKNAEIKRNTPPEGYPIECCEAANAMWKTLYGDDLNLNPGLVSSVKRLEATADRIEAQADIIAKSLRFFGLNTVKGVLALIAGIVSAVFIAKNFLLK